MIPHCDDLFMRYFDRWYSPADRERKGFETTRPDVLTVDSFVGRSSEEVSPLNEEGRAEVRHCIATMLDAVRGDWPRYLPLSGDIDLRWIEAFDRYYDEEKIADVIARSDPADFGNDYLILCCEFGVALGHVLKSMRAGLLWCEDWPYWESSVVDPRRGAVVPVFHWAIKKMSDYGWDDGFLEKLQVCVEGLNDRTE